MGTTPWGDGGCLGLNGLENLETKAAGSKARLFLHLVNFPVDIGLRIRYTNHIERNNGSDRRLGRTGQKKLVDNMLRISYIETIKYGRKLPPLFENLVPKPRGNSMMATNKWNLTSRGPRLKKTSVATRAEIRGATKFQYGMRSGTANPVSPD